MPPGQPPSPDTINRAHPGGDAFEPHQAALERQLHEPWGARDDKDKQLFVPFPDRRNWKRVRFWGVEHFVGFRYGDDHHAVSAAFVLDTPEHSVQTSQTCMRCFEGWGRPQAKNYDVKLGAISTHETIWNGKPLVIRSVDGQVDWAFSRIEFSAAWAAYPAYTDACLAYSMAVIWDGQPELAKKVRDRWVVEGFQHVRPLTTKRPYRK